MLSIDQIPQEWKDRLAEVQIENPTAIIAGGCLRDLWMGKDKNSVKDIDFFIICDTTNEETVYNPSFGYLDWGDTMIAVCDNSYKDFTTPEVGAIHRIEHDYTMEFITVDVVDKMSAIKRFDFGFCQIYFDGKELVYTDEFLNDMNNKTITLVRSDTKEQFDRSMRRAERFQEKFPDYKLEIGAYEHFR